jgi:hypothetical protein
MPRITLALLTAALMATPAHAADAPAPGLPTVASGHRPGPDALYAPPADAPQLQNAGPWKAQPILVSGAAAYRAGEWLYQDFLYDDHGAKGLKDPDDQHDVGSYTYSPVAGTLTYPTAKVFADNAADLVELRIRRVGDTTAFRVTLNTLQDPARTAFTIALGDGPAPVAWPHGAGTSSRAQTFVTVHGAAAEVSDAVSGAVKPGATATVDATRRQVDVRVPSSAFDPGTGKVRVTIGVGLWDATAGTYLAPGPSATADAPGGAAPTRAALFNVGPRLAEPQPALSAFGVAPVSMGDAAAGAAIQANWWRESAQAQALLLGDVSSLAAEVDFAKLAAGADDESQVPKTGSINRILASRHSFGQGIDPSRVCFDIAKSIAVGASCEGRFVGQLQPYTLYVPKRSAPKAGWGMTLLLHSLSANYNQYAASRNQSQLGDRGAGSLVLTPAGRGPDGFYAGIPEADTFEAWADVARHYPLDADWTTVSGYSMGGFGTYRMLARWPDLFARGFSVVGIPGTAMDQLASLRNTPIMAWNSGGDELVNISDSEEAVAALTAAGLRFTERLFPAADHLTLATNDEYGPGAAYLGEVRVDRDPAHVAYVVDPVEDSAAAAAVGDHAYWVSGLRLRDAKKTGTFDVRSKAFGVGDAPVLPVASSEGTLDGGAHGPMAYHERRQAWGGEPPATAQDALVVRSANVAGATIDARRARVSCAPRIELTGDGPVDLQIDCAPPKAADALAACARTVTVALPRVTGRRITFVNVSRRGARLKRVTGRDVRRVVVTRPSEKAFSLRLTLHTSGRKAGRVVVARRFAACR